MKEIIKESSFIGFANPIYGAGIPPIMRSFIRLLTDILKTGEVCPKPLYIINTFGYINAFGPFAANKLFDKNYFKLMAYVNIKMCNNVSTYKHRSKLLSSEDLGIRKERAKVKLKTMTGRLLSSRKYINGIGPYLIPGIFIRKKAGQTIKNNYHALSVQTGTCNGCMMCVNNCPMRCIKIVDQQFEFSEGCTACMRCYNFCPTFSILIDAVFTDPDIYHRYRGP